MEGIVIIDFGSQFTQLIARKVRELGCYCEIVAYNLAEVVPTWAKGVILSGSPHSVLAEDSPKFDIKGYAGKLPILGVCYGAQLIAQNFGGKVSWSSTREYGRAMLQDIDRSSPLTQLLPLEEHQVWMSHGDTIEHVPAGSKVLASTADVKHAAFEMEALSMWGLQFHPEVFHSTFGNRWLKNFIGAICGCGEDWRPDNFIHSKVEEIKAKVGEEDQVIMGLSGGVDSTVAAMLISKAIGKRLHCIFVDNGLLRKDEFAQVLADYEQLGLQVKGVDAADEFMEALAGKTDPELKRKAIGKTFIDVFERESKLVADAAWLGQGTIYPDVIESKSVKGPSATIKSHHNVGGLPDYMKLKVLEPLDTLFKDEVRNVGRAMGISPLLLGRHPFPGPGLAIRILGEVDAEKVALLQQVDAIYIQTLRETGWYDKIWQAGAILLPVQSVGVMGDERTYEKAVALRAVQSVDGMTADWVHLPYSILADISNKIINQVRGVNRVVYDISSKPPATIEWE